MRVSFVLVFVVFFGALIGCGESEEQRTANMAALCAETHDILPGLAESISSGGDATDLELFDQTLNGMLSTCSEACDGGHQASCSTLSVNLAFMCEGDDGMCSRLCSSTLEGSLKETSCRIAGG